MRKLEPSATVAHSSYFWVLLVQTPWPHSNKFSQIFKYKALNDFLSSIGTGVETRVSNIIVMRRK